MLHPQGEISQNIPNSKYDCPEKLSTGLPEKTCLLQRLL
jgi:hypothetical protein